MPAEEQQGALGWVCEAFAGSCARRSIPSISESFIPTGFISLLTELKTQRAQPGWCFSTFYLLLFTKPCLCRMMGAQGWEGEIHGINPSNLSSSRLGVPRRPQAWLGQGSGLTSSPCWSQFWMSINPKICVFPDFCHKTSQQRGLAVISVISVIDFSVISGLHSNTQRR